MRQRQRSVRLLANKPKVADTKTKPILLPSTCQPNTVIIPYASPAKTSPAMFERFLNAFGLAILRHRKTSIQKAVPRANTCIHGDVALRFET